MERKRYVSGCYIADAVAKYTMEGKRMQFLHFPDQITRWLPLGLLVILYAHALQQNKISMGGLL